MSGGAMRALVVDDEPLARKVMGDMLAAHDDVRLVGEAASGRAALERLGEGGVDLLFLDVEMPGLSGLDVVEALAADGGAAGMPHVVFVTAYDQYAIRAFEVHALDYLLKPFDAERLGRALDRARRHLRRAGPAGETERILALLHELHRRDRYLDRLPIRVNDRTFFQPVEAIDWIEANGKYVNVHVGKQVHVTRDGMAQLGEVLDPARFIRISRSAIVNVGSIREVQPWFRGEYVVLLHSGAEVPSTRAFRDNLTRLLERRR